MAPQRTGLYAGFDFENTQSIRQLIAALQYMLDDDDQVNHPALLGLGNTSEERASRLQTVRAIVARMNADTQYTVEVNRLLAAYLRRDSQLLVAAAALLAFSPVPTGVATPSAITSVVATSSARTGLVATPSLMTSVLRTSHSRQPPTSGTRRPYVSPYATSTQLPLPLPRRRLQLQVSSGRAGSFEQPQDDKKGSGTRKEAKKQKAEENQEGSDARKEAEKRMVEEAAKQFAAQDFALPSGRPSSRKPLPFNNFRSGPQPKQRKLSDTLTSSSPPETSVYDNTRLPTAQRRPRHAPSKQRGYDCYDDGSIDRSYAKLGEPDDTKFRIVIPTQKTDPKTGIQTKGKPAEYDYPNKDGFEAEDGKTLLPFDWNKDKHIKALHQWREQVFRRRIGGRRATRKPWLESEKAYLLGMIEDQLKRHQRPKFGKLANAYNRRFHGTIQRKGQRQVFAGKKNDGGLLEEDRPAPWRTVSALSGQTFKWQEYADMLKKKDEEAEAAAAKDDTKNDVVYSSADEIEDPDPTPPQTEFKPRKYKQWRRYDAKAASKQSPSKITAEAPSKTTEETPSQTTTEAPSKTTAKAPSKTAIEGPSKKTAAGKTSVAAGNKRKYAEASDDAEEEEQEEEDSDSELSDSSSDVSTVPDYPHRMRR